MARAVSSALGDTGPRSGAGASGSLDAMRSSITSLDSDGRGTSAASGLTDWQPGSL